MTQKIGMNVEAVFDPSGVQQGIQKIDQAVNEANKNQLEPIAPGTQKQLDDVADAVQNVGEQVNKVNAKPINPVSPQAGKQLDELNKRFQQLLKVDAELRRRIKATGQEGKLFEEIDWGATHPDKAARAKKVAAVHDYLAGGSGDNRPPNLPPNHPPEPAKPKEHSTAAQMAANVAQSGLRAAGPAGGVAANAIGTGMSAGAGAGLMGLLGGVLALGVGKAVSGVMEKIGQAEDNSVAYDRLKRTIGDVNVSFEALKSVVTDGADNLRITYSEFGQLSTQFAKAGNLKDTEFSTLPDEVGVGVGMSRAYGLDPSQGVGLMGAMRGMGITSSVNESRKFALLIGETIGKSGAFAKADEVMQAIGGYAESQTRNSMSRANVDGYGGMYSSMVGSGIPGMDATSSAALLNRINASLSAGGAKGEASQFFTGMVGSRMGLDPLKTQVMREGGMFATNDGMFGKDSAYSRYMGQDGPSGSDTFFDKTRETLEQQYGGDSDDQKLLRAQAFANHTGVNMNQSMAMLSLKPNQMGEMQKYVGDISKLNASGIGNLSKVVNGTDDDRKSVAESLKNRDDVSYAEAQKIDTVMKTGSVDEQKQLLAEMVSSREQERTTGSDIRDSKNALDNIKTSIADKLVPLTLEMRHGIMAIAGKDGKSSTEIMKGVVEADAKSRVNRVESGSSAKVEAIESEYDGKKKVVRDQYRTNAFKLTHDLSEQDIRSAYNRNPEMLAKKLAERAKLEAETVELQKKGKELEEEKQLLIKKEIERKREELADIDARKQKELAGIDEAIESRQRLETPRGGGKRSGSNGEDVKIGKTAWSMDDIGNDEERKNVKTMLDVIAASEGAGYNTLVGGSKIDDLSKHPNKVGLTTADGPSTAFGRYQITGSTWKGVSGRLGLPNIEPENQDKAAVELMRQRGALDMAKKGDFRGAIGKLGKEWVSLPSSTNQNQGKRSWEFVDKVIERSRAAQETAVASAGAGRGGDPRKMVEKPTETTATVGKPPVAAVPAPKGEKSIAAAPSASEPVTAPPKVGKAPVEPTPKAAKPLTVAPPGKVEVQELPPVGVKPVTADEKPASPTKAGKPPVEVAPKASKAATTVSTPEMPAVGAAPVTPAAEKPAQGAKTVPDAMKTDAKPIGAAPVTESEKLVKPATKLGNKPVPDTQDGQPKAQPSAKVGTSTKLETRPIAPLGDAPVKVEVMNFGNMPRTAVANMPEYRGKDREPSKRLDPAFSEERKLANTPLPKDFEAGREEREYMSGRIVADPIVVRHENDKGEMVRPDQTIQTRVASNWTRG